MEYRPFGYHLKVVAVNFVPDLSIQWLLILILVNLHALNLFYLLLFPHLRTQVQHILIESDRRNIQRIAHHNGRERCTFENPLLINPGLTFNKLTRRWEDCANQGQALSAASLGAPSAAALDITTPQ